MDIAGLGRFANDAGPHPFAHPTQMMMHCTHGQKHRDRNLVMIHPAIGQNDNADVLIHRFLNFLANAADSFFQTRGSFADRPQAGDGRGGKIAAENLQFFHFGVEQDR